MPDTTTSICLKERRAQQQTNLCVRPVEVGKGRNWGEEQWWTDDFHRELIRLFNISQIPQRYPDVKDRPKRKLSGQTCYDWIAKRMKCDSNAVRCWLSGAAEVPDPVKLITETGDMAKRKVKIQLLNETG